MTYEFISTRVRKFCVASRKVEGTRCQGIKDSLSDRLVPISSLTMTDEVNPSHGWFITDTLSLS